MTRELRERVARLLARETEGSEEWWTLYMRRADTAIALVLEEAAKVCDEHAARYEKDIEKGDDDGTLQSVAASLRGRAAAIRALKEGK